MGLNVDTIAKYVVQNHNVQFMKESDYTTASKEEAQKAFEQEMENDKKKMGSYYDEMFGGSNNKSKQIFKEKLT